MHIHIETNNQDIITFIILIYFLIFAYIKQIRKILQKALKKT